MKSVAVKMLAATVVASGSMIALAPAHALPGLDGGVAAGIAAQVEKAGCGPYGCGPGWGGYDYGYGPRPRPWGYGYGYNSPRPWAWGRRPWGGSGWGGGWGPRW